MSYSVESSNGSTDDGEFTGFSVKADNQNSWADVFKFSFFFANLDRSISKSYNADCRNLFSSAKDPTMNGLSSRQNL